MSWIKVETGLPNNPKLIDLAEVLGCSEATAVGHLTCLWSWAFEYAPDGDLSKFRPASIARGVKWDGSPEQLVSTLVDSGWLDQDDERIVIHDWKEHYGSLIKLREDAKKRQQKKREKDKESRPDHVEKTDVTVMSRVTNGDITLQTRQDKKREERQEQEETREGQPAAPASIDDLISAWQKPTRSESVKPVWEKMTNHDRAWALKAQSSYQAKYEGNRGDQVSLVLWLRNRMFTNEIQDPASANTEAERELEYARKQWAEYCTEFNRPINTPMPAMMLSGNPPRFNSNWYLDFSWDDIDTPTALGGASPNEFRVKPEADIDLASLPY